jgi:adenylate cyclase
VKGLSHSPQAFIKENLTRGLADWQRALALDSASAALNGMLGFLHYVDARFGWWDDRKSAGAKARAYADRAPELDPENPDANTASSLVMLLKRRYDEAAIHARKAARLAPGSADAATYACYVIAFAGYPKEAMAHDERAMTLSLHYPGYLGILGNAYRLAGRFAQAITSFKAYHDRNPGFGLSDLVIAYQQANRPEQAKATAQQLLSIRRDFTTDSWANTQYFRADTAQLEADIGALRAAGLPVN